MKNLESTIKMRLAKLNMQAKDLIEIVGLSSQSALNKIYNRNSARHETLVKIAAALKISVEELTGDEPNSNINNSKAFRKDEDYIDLPIVLAKARATFANSLIYDSNIELDSYRVLKTDTKEDFKDNMIFEIDGDSMEPLYTQGTKVRAKKVHPGDWVYITSAVYVVHYSKSFLVVKRVKTNELQEKGYLKLHSDNEETGGTVNVKLEDINSIWKVLRIVDAPAR